MPRSSTDRGDGKNERPTCVACRGAFGTVGSCSSSSMRVSIGVGRRRLKSSRLLLLPRGDAVTFVRSNDALGDGQRFRTTPFINLLSWAIGDAAVSMV